MKKLTILYVGGFQLPDKNAAAHRVISNAKALRALGHTVIFINALTCAGPESMKHIRYHEFDCYEYKRESQIRYLTGIKHVIDIINERMVTDVIAYNYPAIALNKVRKYCQAKGVRCYADVTEWYLPIGTPLFRLVKGLDTYYRMKYVHFRMDGIIAISEVLYQYYRKRVKTVKIPPMVDILDKKWSTQNIVKQSIPTFVYAGTPSMQKERLDLIVGAVNRIGKNEEIQLIIVGITREQYEVLYGILEADSNIIFKGWVPNQEAIEIVSQGNWSVVIRDKNQLVQAGFPTKVVDSISCGVPIIANNFSNLSDYLDETNSILIDDTDNIESAMLLALSHKLDPNKTIFDYHNYLSVMEFLFEPSIKESIDIDQS